MSRFGYLYSSCVIFSCISICVAQTSKLDSLLLTVKTLPDDTVKVFVYQKISNAYRLLRTHNEEARAYADSSLHLAEALHFNNGIASAHYYYGGIEEFESNYDKALSHFDEYLKYYEAQADSTRIVNGLYSIGKVYKQTGEFDKALQAYYRVVSICERTNDLDMLSRTLNSMGGIFKQMKQYQKAIDSYEKAKALYLKLDMTKDYGMSFQNIGNVYAAQEKYDSAIRLYKQALQVVRGLGVVYEESIVLGNLGSTYQRMNNYNDALLFQLQSLSIKRTLPNKRSLVFALGDVGVTYVKLKKYNEAESFLKEAFQLSQQIGAKDQIENISFELSQLYAAKNNFQEAYQFGRLAYQWKDSVFNETTSQQINELQAKYETERKDKQIELLAKEGALREKEMERQTILKNTSIVGIALVTILAIIIGYSYRQKLRNQKLLALKDSEINEAHFKRQMSELEMKALRAQINPHFLFNCMNSINRMILEGENQNASQYLAKFSKLVRLILENAEGSKVSLQSEITLLESYIQLEKLRFKGKINHKIVVDGSIDPDATYLPSMILQPFVENAIWHGLMHKSDNDKGMVEISVREKNGSLYCVIEDNGVGRDKARALAETSVVKTKSMGMKITEERLRLLSKQNLDKLINIVDIKDSFDNALGTRIEINFPSADR